MPLVLKLHSIATCLDKLTQFNLFQLIASEDDSHDIKRDLIISHSFLENMCNTYL